MSSVDIDDIRTRLEKFGALESCAVCPGRSFGFATFVEQESAVAACTKWPLEEGVTGVRLGFARREAPILPKAKRASGGRLHAKMKRKRRRLGVGEPIASWAKTEEPPTVSTIGA